MTKALSLHNHDDMTNSSPLFGFNLTPYAAQLQSGVTLNQWGKGLYFLATIERSSQWWLGDLWLLGEAVWGEDAAQLTSEYANGTIRNAAVVCKRFDVAFRQEYVAALDEDALSFAHFQRLTKIESNTDVHRWLSRAIENGWSAARLADEIEGHNGGRKAFRLSMTDMQDNAIRLAAKLTPENLRLLRDAIDKQLGE